MAITITKAQGTVFGNLNVWQGTLETTTATGVVSFGFGRIAHIEACMASCTSTGPRNWSINQSATSVAQAGDVAVTGCVAGDLFFITVYGN